MELEKLSPVVLKLSADEVKMLKALLECARCWINSKPPSGTSTVGRFNYLAEQLNLKDCKEYNDLLDFRQAMWDGL